MNKLVQTLRLKQSDSKLTKAQIIRYLSQVQFLARDASFPKPEIMVKLFLRVAIAAGFLSAVADRFGFWPKEVSAWGNWESFIAYTKQINPIIPESMIPALGGFVTAAEVIFAFCLIIGFKTEMVAKMSGFLMLLFALAMITTSGIKGVFDYSVLAASAGAFALGTMKQKSFEIDLVLARRKP